MSNNETEWWERLPLWHGFPLDPKQHPTRPWWRIYTSLGVATRTDGAYLVDVGSGDKPGTTRIELQHARDDYPNRRLAKADWSHDGEGLDPWSSALAAYDKAHPLTAPPPRAGQVWVFLVGGEFDDSWVVAGRNAAGAWHLQGGEDLQVWPPPQSVLVSGAFAPWGPEAAGHEVSDGD